MKQASKPPKKAKAPAKPMPKGGAKGKQMMPPKALGGKGIMGKMGY